MRDIPGLTRAAPPRFAAMAKLACPVAAVTGRGATREAAILGAVVELLNEISYESLTMDAVAARAKASKATIYRRWSNKDDLVVDALRRTFALRQDALPDTGNLRDDVVARIVQHMEDPTLFAANIAALKGLVYAASSDAELAVVIRTALEDAHLEAWQVMLGRAYARGELRTPVSAALVWEVAQAQFCARTSVECGRMDAGYVAHIVDDVLMPVISHADSRHRLPAPG